MSEALLSIRDVHYTHRLSGGVSVPALRGVSLELQPGEIVGIVGESGCGKSTRARAVMGLLAPQKGEICYNGINVH
ncbi:MAG: ATP-binding cassette domain-containing protein, partial [Firmicutes bacterium]|nr:ATP-binding cassette domain-containing protein [Bacillota bacterium]